MHLQKIVFLNRAPFDNLSLDFEEHGINVLSAINGKGKTTVLSQIVDAFHEMAKVAYHNSYSGDLEGKYYRVLTSRYALDTHKPALAYIRFVHKEECFDYIELIGKIDEDLYNQIDIEDKISYRHIDKELSESSSTKILSSNCTRKNIPTLFEASIMTYFPAYRFEIPGFMNDEFSNRLLYDISTKYSGYLPNPIENVTGLPQLANWLMDIVLDYQLYKDSASLNLKQALNQILTLTVQNKTKKDVRLGIGPRNNTSNRISIVHDDGKQIQTIYPSIFEISAGESALLCIFGEILRQSDHIGQTLNCEGIVLIDEVDKHLHIILQCSILPKLFNLFPRIQFIVSSHSPFLTMGLGEVPKNRTKLIDLDNNGLITSPRNTELYKSVYELFVNENNNFAKELESIKTKVAELNKPIIITEGKTDWKHLKAALSYFQARNEFADLNIEIVEYDFDFGDSKLHSLLNQYKQFPQRNIIIGIFDCDEANGKNIHKDGGIRKYADNVWGISIDIPSYREYNTSGISIEFLYTDEDLKKVDVNKRRLYVTSEFNENGRLKENKVIGVKNNHDVKNYVKRENEKIQCDEVINIEGNSLALSKEMFASNIYNKVKPFDEMNFSSFREIFNRILSIINNKLKK